MYSISQLIKIMRGVDVQIFPFGVIQIKVQWTLSQTRMGPRNLFEIERVRNREREN